MNKMIRGFLFSALATVSAVSIATAAIDSVAVAASQVITLQIQGLAQEEAMDLEHGLGAVPGVSLVKVSSDLGVAVVVYDPVQVKPDLLSQKVQEAGHLASFAKANYKCPKCTAAYEKAGDCIVCHIPTEKV